MVNNKRNVKITASNVNVTSSKTNNSQQQQSNGRRRRRNRRGRNNFVNEEFVVGGPAGIESGLSGLVPKPQRITNRNRGQGVVSNPITTLAESSPLTEQAACFFKNYCDPCGEHSDSLDAARVPDGALASSAGSFFRLVETIVFPWQIAGTTDLTGLTYSMLWLQLPLFRALTIVLAKRNDGEFGPDTMDRFVTVFANLVSSTDAYYPNWVSLGDDGDNEFFTVFDTAALRNVVPPVDGVSGTVDSYRFSSQGLVVRFNTPDLLDQGTFTVMRYPTNHATKNSGIANEIAGSIPVYLTGLINNGFPGTAPGSTILTLNQAPMSNLFPSFIGNFSSLPSPAFTSISDFQNASGSFIVSVGDVLQYTGVAGTPALLQLTNVTTTNSITLRTVPGINSPVGNSEVFQRFYLLSVVEGSPEEVVDFETTNIVIPPVTQADMYQQNPRMVAELAKETNGTYAVSSIFQPIFNVTSSLSYRKIVLQRHGAPLIDLINPITGWFDTVDDNFGITVVNFQGVPYACKPMIKIARSVELVPSSDSFVGAFTTGCPPAQPEAVDACKAFTDNQPHGYPTNYNGLGKLFGMALKVVEMLPALHRSGRNISRCVKEVCDAEAVESSTSEIVELAARGFKRLVRLR